MQIIPSLLFGISASLDALIAGITFGIRGVRIRLWHNLLISIITLAGTCLSVGFGAKLTFLLSAEMWRLAGSLILILFGFYYITKYMFSLVKKYRMAKQLTTISIPHKTNDAPCRMTLPEACTLGCALSANNMGIGLSASIAGLSLLPAATVTFLFSFTFLWMGNQFSLCRTLHLTENTANLISGALLVGLGILSLLNAGL